MSGQATGDTTVERIPAHGHGRLAPLWQKGQTGNPGGITSSRHEYNEAKKICAQNTVKAIMKQIELMDHEDGRVAFIATEAILNRGIGKPKEGDDAPMRVDLSALTDADRATLALLLRKLLGGV